MYRVVATLRPLVCPCIMALALGGCGGGDMSSAGGVDAERVTPSDTDPTPVPTPAVAARALEQRLVTAYDDAANHESWVCIAERSLTEYLLRVATTGERHGQERVPGIGARSSPLQWTATGADTLLLDRRDLGRQVELNAILFGGPDAFRANGGTGGTLECRRQRYVDGEATRDVSGAVPIDIDRDAEAALALATRVRTRYADSGSFDYWLCTGGEAGPLRHLFGDSGVFAAEPLAKVFGENESLEAARVYRWAASDGSTLVMTAADGYGPDAAPGTDGAREGTLTFAAIVFPVDGALAATRGDGAAMQCVLQTFGARESGP